MCMRIFIWRARRRFTFQIGNRARMRQIKVSVVARAVSIKASARNCILLARMYTCFCFCTRGACSFLHTQLYLRRRERRGKRRRSTSTYTESAFGCSAHLSGLFAKRFMISDSDMAERSSINFTITHGARQQIKRRLRAPVLMMRRAFGLSPGLDFAVKCRV